MSKVIARLVLAVFVATMFLNVSIVSAAPQNDLEISNVNTDVLPEYDTPDILVVHTIQLKNISQQDFSGEIRWAVPNGSKTHIVADETSGSTRINFKLEPKNGLTEMVFRLSKPMKAGETRNIHLEYYYNNLQGSPDKNFSFEFQQAYPVAAGQVLVYQPLKASNFRLTPEMGAPVTGATVNLFPKKVH